MLYDMMDIDMMCGSGKIVALPVHRVSMSVLRRR